MGISATRAEEFWDKVEVDGPCWNWRGHIQPDGYGSFGRTPVHRISYEIANGEIPPGILIDHICHNRACVNPAHLRPVTKKQNAEHRKGANLNSGTGVRGVWRLPNGKYKARVMHEGRSHHVGTFASLADAEAATVAKRLELFTHNEMDRQVAA